MTLEDMNMKLSLIELYDLIGIDKGINFLYEELPGVVVTIGFSEYEDDDNGTNDDDESNGDDDGGEEPDGLELRRSKARSKMH